MGYFFFLKKAVTLLGFLIININCLIIIIIIAVKLGKIVTMQKKILVIITAKRITAGEEA